MRSSSVRLYAFLAPVLVGLVTSTLLFVDYLRGAPIICEDGGGCDALKRSALGYPLGIPTPLFGVVGFIGLGVLCLMRGPRARAWFVGAAIAAAFVGSILVAAQFVLGTFCPFCVVTDLAAVTLPLVAVVRQRAAWDMPRGRSFAALGWGTLVVAFVLPFEYAFLKRPMLPEVIAKELAKAPAGRAMVVDFVDFECPFCREEQTELTSILATHEAEFVVVRKLVPLTRIHPHAMDAARAACCGERLGKGDAMADALFAAPVDDLTSSGCERIAVSLGLDAGAYEACLADPATTARVEADKGEFEKAATKHDGLPLMWVGDTKLMGLQEPSAIRRAVERAIAHAGT